MISSFSAVRLEESSVGRVLWVERPGIYSSLSASVYSRIVNQKIIDQKSFIRDVFGHQKSGVAMIALHQRGQRIQESFRAVQRIHVKLRFVFIPLVVRVKHHGRNALVVAF